MPVIAVPENQRIWQAIASAYRPPQRPFALYAADEKMGELHAGTLGINFAWSVNTLAMHNAWMVGAWFGPYPLRVPDEEHAALFPKLVTPAQAARGVGYQIADPSQFDPRHLAPPLPLPDAAPGVDVPKWVQAYENYLLNQLEYYGRVVRRETRREWF